MPLRRLAAGGPTILRLRHPPLRRRHRLGGEGQRAGRRRATLSLAPGKSSGAARDARWRDGGTQSQDRSPALALRPFAHVPVERQVQASERSSQAQNCAADLRRLNSKDAFMETISTAEQLAAATATNSPV